MAVPGVEESGIPGKSGPVKMGPDRWPPAGEETGTELFTDWQRHARRLEALAEMQHEVLGLVLAQEPLPRTLEWIARRVEEIAEGQLLCSIYLAEAGGTRLRFMAGPSLPEEFIEAGRTIPVRESAGFSGPAAARGKAVIVGDTTTHPDWENVRSLVIRHQLYSCWSMPVLAADGGLLGTMDVYHRVPRSPEPEELRWMEAAVRLTGLAIGHTVEAARLKENNTWLTAMLESVDDAFFTLDREWRFVTLNRQTGRLLQRSREELLGKVIWEEFREAAGTAFEVNCRSALTEQQVMIFEEFQSGPQRWLEVRIHPSELGVAIYFRDVTARRQADAALRESEERFKSVARATADAVWDLDLERRTIWWSDGLERLFGYPLAQVGQDLAWWAQHIHADDRIRVETHLEQSIESGMESWSDEYRFRRHDASYAHVLDRGFVVRDAAGKALRLVGGMTDLTERHRGELEARSAAELHGKIASILREIAAVELNLQAVIDLVAARARDLVSADGAVVGLVEGADVVYSAVSGSAAPFRDLRVPLQGSLSGLAVEQRTVLRSGDTETDPRADLESCRKVGARSLLVAPLRSGTLDVGVLKFFAARTDAFTDRQASSLEILAESLGAVILNHLTAGRLKASEAQYRLLFDHNPHPMWAYDVVTFQFLAVNAAAVEHYGYSRREFLAMTVRELHPSKDLPLLEKITEGVTALEQPHSLWRHRRKDGPVMEVEISSDPLTFNGRDARLVLAHDVTERRRSERELARLNRAQRMLSNCNGALFREDDETALLHRICRVAVEIGNYRMAWIGYAHDDAACSIEPVASAGAEYGYLSRIKLTWRSDVPAGQGPAGIAIRTGQPYICEDVMRDDILLVSRDDALERGYRGIICLPLKDGNRSFGLLSLWSAKVRTVTAEEIRLLQELADDTAFGILNLRSRAESARLQAAIVKVAASVSAGTGAEFFQQLVLNMADALGACGSVVGRLLPHPHPKIRTIAAVMDGQVVADFEYLQEDSPCGELAVNDDCVISSGVASRYPALPALAGCGAGAYVGRLLRNAAGDPVGVLYLLFRKPLTDSSFISSTLKIFAARAAGELQRQEDDARIRQQASLLDKAQDAIMVRDLDQNIIFWNKGAERLYGWTAAEVTGRKLEPLLQVEPARLAKALEAVLQSGEWNGLIEKTARDGTHITLDSRWTLLRDSTGHPKSIFTIDTDITEKHKLEQQFLRAQRMESIGTLAGGIAHDLNNVLAPIIMSIDLLKLTVSDPDNREVLDTIADSARRGAAMVGQVLSFARGMEGRRAPVHPRQLISEIEKIARDTFPKNIRLQTILPAHLWMLEGDHTQLHQVLLNLCVNARDAMPGGGTITLSAANLEVDAHYAGMHLQAKTGPHIVLQAEDTGSGIPAHIIEKIFDPFFTTKELGKGTGLGLSTSLAIIKSHGGFVRVYSEHGKGTVFRIYLPAQTSDPVLEMVPDIETIVHGRGELVLVIDDEPSIISITRQTLESFGYRVMVATDGAEAVTLYARHRAEIAVVLTDMMMPVMDGPSTIHVLMRMNPAVRIIAASGICSNNAVARAAGTAVRHFLAKPYTAQTLLRTLRSVLDEEN